MNPESAQVIRDRLDRMAARRTFRVRLLFPKRPHCKTGRMMRRPPEGRGPISGGRTAYLVRGYARRSSSL